MPLESVRPVDDHSQPRRGVDGIKEDLARQVTLMANRAAPYRKLALLIIRLLEDPVSGRAVHAGLKRAWRNREFLSFYERPLLLFAALRSEAIADGPAHPLYRALCDTSPDADAITPATLKSALDQSRTGLWTALGLRRVQTNETSRALAWLWPAAIAGCSNGARPLIIVDVGCSAGLNLIGDTLEHGWTTSAGKPLPVLERAHIVARLGIDERPLDVSRPDDAQWLRACVWPGETDRLQRLDDSIAAWRAARARGDHIEIVRRDATSAAALARDAAANAPPGTLTIVYQTMMSGYLDSQSRSAFEASLSKLVVSSPSGSLLWIDLEVTGSPTSPRPAELLVHARSGDQCVRFLIGTMGYHPSEVVVREEAVGDLTKLLSTQRARRSSDELPEASTARRRSRA